MARKDLLKGLMEAPAPSSETPAPPRYERGAIGAVSKSINDLRSRAIVDVHPDMIDDAGLRDRLDEDPEGLAALVESIREYGQQVPVLLRHSPNEEGRYEVVYGRRRVAALKALQQPVKAMLRELNDKELIVAQGQENSARKDLSFIEKASFAAQMVAMDFDRKVICDALSIDKTVISRMLSVTDAVPDALIRKIGSAPSAGRDRWLLLAGRAEGRSLDELLDAAIGPDSDARFEAVLAALQTPKPSPAAPRILAGADGDPLGQARKTKGKTVIELTGGGRAFADWLIDHMAELHRDWQDKNR
ncbi:plasmid partitioning protein RepB [Paracoccus sp. SCSIO 75233]|uniref:plasmid partitioning protein RepB n=1 Tax=Paracoccus sp. SCSIO 75233 TaxID=3017782 RepID=UPI0022EFDD51|nr:plasmid partitioning protein RepB [Paracoccus sp. SCSIO 75233]WBU55329.1 plasmid partitioning protein RepB [Paracoccus sp. SCSIO 75233]